MTFFNMVWSAFGGAICAKNFMEGDLFWAWVFVGLIVLSAVAEQSKR